MESVVFKNLKFLTYVYFTKQLLLCEKFVSLFMCLLPVDSSARMWLFNCRTHADQLWSQSPIVLVRPATRGCARQVHNLRYQAIADPRNFQKYALLLCAATAYNDLPPENFSWLPPWRSYIAVLTWQHFQPKEPNWRGFNVCFLWQSPSLIVIRISAIRCFWDRSKEKRLSTSFAIDKTLTRRSFFNETLFAGRPAVWLLLVTNERTSCTKRYL